MVGKTLTGSLETSGSQVRRFVRAARTREPGTIAWNPETGASRLQAGEVEGSFEGFMDLLVACPAAARVEDHRPGRKLGERLPSAAEPGS